MNVCIVRCRNRHPSVFASGRRRGCARRIRLAQGRERIRQEVLKLRIGNAPAARFAAGVPDLQRSAGIVVDKGGTVNEVIVPFIITRCEERLLVRRPRFPVLRGAKQKIRPIGVAALRVGAEQTPVFVLALRPTARPDAMECKRLCRRHLSEQACLQGSACSSSSYRLWTCTARQTRPDFASRCRCCWSRSCSTTSAMYSHHAGQRQATAYRSDRLTVDQIGV